MSDLRVLQLSSRTASLLLAPGGARYAVPVPISWQLSCGDKPCASGKATVAPLFFENLTPDTEYCLTTPLGRLCFRTLKCAGLVDARNFGADPRAADNTAAIQRAIDATPEGGTLRIAPGRYTIGPIFLKPRMTFYLPEGAELNAHGDWSNWPILPARDDTGRPLSSWEGLPEAAFAAPVTAIDCHGLILTGRGVIDGGGDRGDWWSWPKSTRRDARRPRTLFLAWSDDIQISGLTIRNSPSWTVHPFRCDRLTASALHIQNPADSPNTDGLNPESCCDVTLTGLHFSVGDDCIAVKAGKRGDQGQSDHLAPTTGLAVTHCLMERGHGAVVLGSEMSGDITGVTITDCTFDRTDRGLRIKTRRGRGGRVANVVMERVDMTYVDTPVVANAYYFCDPDGSDDWVQSRKPAPVTEKTPAIDNILVRNVTAKMAKLAGAAMLGLPESPITNVRLEYFSVTFDPDAEPAEPLMAEGQTPVRHIPMIAENTQVTGEPLCAEPLKDPILC